MPSSKKKFQIEFDGWEELAEQYKKLGGDTKELTEKVLTATHSYITPKIHSRMTKGNMPAGGKYVKGSEPEVNKQIIDDVNIEWVGTSATVDIGFSLDEGPLPIYLIYGTERSNGTKTSPVTGLKSTIYGAKTKNEVAEIQEQIFTDEINRRLLDGK